MFTYRTKLKEDDGRPRWLLHCRFEGGHHCPICNEWNHDAYSFRYSEYICEKCFKSGVIEKLDDIFIYFIEHRTKPTLRQRLKFSVLESLAYDAFREKIKDRAREIKLIRERNKKTEVNLKYTEERRILNRTW